MKWLRKIKDKFGKKSEYPGYRKASFGETGLELDQELFSVSTGIVNPFNEASRDAVQYINSLEGVVGFNPEKPHDIDGTLWLFNSEYNAVSARNLMESKGIECGRCIGKYICKPEGIALIEIIDR